MRYNSLDIDLSNKGINRILCVGDIHGEYDPFIHEIKQQSLHDCFIVICGDIGLGFYKHGYYELIFSTFQKVLKERNIYLILYRGNHDDPSYFKYDGAGGEMFDFYYPNIIILDDYSIVKFNSNLTALFIGGARSIDKQYSIINKKPYWYDEGVKPVNKDIVERLRNHKNEIDVVFTHTACSFLDTGDGNLPPNLIQYYAALGDISMMEDIKAERELLDSIYNDISSYNDIKYWICGHFHTHVEMLKDDKTKFVCLDRFRDELSMYGPYQISQKPYLGRKTKSDYFILYEE